MNNGIYLAPTPAQQVAKAAAPSPAIFERLDIPGLVYSLNNLPDQLADLGQRRANLQKALREAGDALDMANMPLEVIAMSEGTNDATRKAALKKRQAESREYRAARDRLNKLQTELDTLAVDIALAENRFAGVRTVARLVAAQIEYMSK